VPFVRSSFAVVGLLVLTSCSRDAASPTGQPSPDPGQAASPGGGTRTLTALSPGSLAVVEPEAQSSCPEDMVLVEGMYCPEVRHTCKKYMDPPGRYEYFRCAEYEQPAACLSPQRKFMRFCVDRDEYVKPGETLPANYQSFTMAERICKSENRRVCLESEWNFACEGEEMRPYPYGFKRDPTACNADRTDILSTGGNLKDLRVPGNAYPRCTSPFGVRNLSGNLEEFVAIDSSSPVRPAMKGAYWQPSRNFCRAAQTAHDRYYNGTETGFRCCADARDK
jgi:formylglycine-generating enzyme